MKGTMFYYEFMHTNADFVELYVPSLIYFQTKVLKQAEIQASPTPKIKA